MQMPAVGQVWRDAAGEEWKIQDIKSVVFSARRESDGAIADMRVTETSEEPEKPASRTEAPPQRQQAASEAARFHGYTGEFCGNPDCQSLRVRRAGFCLLCDDCGWTTGCS